MRADMVEVICFWPSNQLPTQDPKSSQVIIVCLHHSRLQIRGLVFNRKNILR
ncbi:hypothetical protein OIU78_025922 [Salix suchowensis]|nr:hypothetical protein OIU78_025922 [Salix suchowensis]